MFFPPMIFLDDRTTRMLTQYLRVLEGWSAQKARTEARRITDLLKAALNFGLDSKKVMREAKRTLGDPGGKRQKGLQALGDRLERLYEHHAGYRYRADGWRGVSGGPPKSGLTRGQRRWFLEIRSYIGEAAEMAHGPSPNAIARIQAQIDQPELHLREHAQHEM